MFLNFKKCSCIWKVSLHFKIKIWGTVISIVSFTFLYKKGNGEKQKRKENVKGKTYRKNTKEKERKNDLGMF